MYLLRVSLQALQACGLQVAVLPALQEWQLLMMAEAGSRKKPTQSDPLAGQPTHRSHAHLQHLPPRDRLLGGLIVLDLNTSIQAEAARANLPPRAVRELRTFPEGRVSRGAACKAPKSAKAHFSKLFFNFT